MKGIIPSALEKQFARILCPGQQTFPLHFFKTSGRPDESATQKAIFQVHSPSPFPPLPNHFMCLITHLLLPAPKYYVAMHSSNRILYLFLWLCYSQAYWWLQMAPTIVIYYGRGLLFSVSSLSIYTWHLVACCQVHYWYKAVCMVR